MKRDHTMKASPRTIGLMAAAALALAAGVTLRAQSVGGRSDFNPSTRPANGLPAGGAGRAAPTTASSSAGPSGPSESSPSRSWNGGGNGSGSGWGNFNNGGTDSRTRNFDFGGRNRSRDDRGSRRDRTGFSSSRGPTTSKTLDDSYALVMRKSIFARDRRTSDPQTRSANERTDWVRPPSPMVFNGVVEVDGATVAFVEDTGAGSIRQYRLGDSVNGKGKVTSIDLDSMEIETDGKRVRVHVGQTLDGGEAPSLMDRASWGGGSPSSSEGASPSSAPPTGPNADILAKLKARRAAEMSGKGGTPPGSPPAPGGTPPAQPPR